MVTIIPKVESPGERFGKAIGGGFERGVQKGMDFATELAMEKYKRGLMAQQGLASVPSEFRQQAKIQQLMKGGPVVAKEPVTLEEAAIPQAMIRETKPTEVSPEARTRIMTPDEMKSEAGRRVAQYAAMNIPTTYQEQLGTLQAENALNLQYQQIQEKAAQLATAKLGDMFKDATQEHQSLFEKKAENLLLQGLTPAQINSALTKDIKQFTNRLATIEKALPPSRGFTKIKNKLLGRGLSESEAYKTVRNKVEPLLEEGLQDTAKNLLSRAGYGTEEIESIVSTLGDTAKKELASFAKISPKEKKTRLFSMEMTEPQVQKFNQSLENILTKDPSTNLILLRKQFEDRGVDWRTFLSGINRLIGEQKYRVPDDQIIAETVLQEPPLDKLDELLFGFGLKGR